MMIKNFSVIFMYILNIVRLELKFLSAIVCLGVTVLMMLLLIQYGFKNTF